MIAGMVADGTAESNHEVALEAVILVPCVVE